MSCVKYDFIVINSVIMKYNDTDRIVEGFGSVENVDSQGDFISTERLRQLMPTYMERGGVLMDAHTNRHIGNIINWDLRDKDDKQSIYLIAKIFEDYSIDDMVWDAVKKKHYTGFSFGGRSIDKDVQCNTERCFNNIKDLEVWEWSLVPKPSNKESIFTNINTIAKGDRMSTVLVPRVENGEITYDAVNVSMETDGMLNKADTESEKMDDYQAPMEEEKGDNNMTEYEKAGSQSRGPKQTSAKEYNKMPVENISGALASAEEGHQKPQRGADSRHRQKKYDETSSQVYGSKHGAYDREAATEYDEGHPEQKSTRMRDKAQRIGKRTDRDMDKEDTPMTAPAEESGNPMNKIISMLESIEDRLTNLEGGSEEKAQLEDYPDETEKAGFESPRRSGKRHGIGDVTDDHLDSVMYGVTPEERETGPWKPRTAKDRASNRRYERTYDEASKEAEKAETVKTVTVPEPQKQQEDKILQKSDSDKLNRLDELAGELKKMGYTAVTTPKPGVDPAYPIDQSGGVTVGGLLNKSEGALDIHNALSDKSFKELDVMFRRD